MLGLQVTFSMLLVKECKSYDKRQESEVRKQQKKKQVGMRALGKTELAGAPFNCDFGMNGPGVYTDVPSLD